MSVTITAMSIPQVAYGPWEKIDRYLAEADGDWPRLRGGLIHLVCERVGRDAGEEGRKVTRLEETLLCQHYHAANLSIPFLTVLDAVRAELDRWPAELLNVCEWALDDDIGYPTRPTALPLTLEALREYGPRAHRTPSPPVQHLRRFIGGREPARHTTLAPRGRQ
jgi:hypothetical protein